MQTFRCQNMDLYDFLNHADMGDAQGQGSSSWGWRDRRSGREFGIVGQFNGAAFVEVLRNGKMVYMYVPKSGRHAAATLHALPPSNPGTV
jgi:hypothetical protein